MLKSTILWDLIVLDQRNLPDMKYIKDYYTNQVVVVVFESRHGTNNNY